ncbi:VTT domain-containing protein [Phragmitibacter flavus]|uniref:TVP38/TMEM64 family membrane protein n=1 Tax=Phragmitibacter flavus TaxID=2576071 RepID=A0A5R8KFU4_9BACT|nr:VTT domain-containing protein [Phragmitibacter flavus]TLD71182.1 VTT domain-containing protein [Phragmitibacter flavus]
MTARSDSHSRWWVLVGVLLALIIGPFVIWGGWFEGFFDLMGVKVWLEGLGSWAWAGGMLLLMADLVLPIPGTVVMSALGLVYGWFWGGVVSVVGSVLSGMLAYGVCRWWGHGAARWLAGEEGLRRGEVFFKKESAGWLVALSRWMPVLPEAVACLAGLARMPWWRFLLAVVTGSVPLGFAFAAIGALGVVEPGLALGLSAGLPVLLYGAAFWWMRRRR